MRKIHALQVIIYKFTSRKFHISTNRVVKDIDFMSRDCDFCLKIDKVGLTCWEMRYILKFFYVCGKKYAFTESAS